MSERTVYRHFPTQRDLLQAVTAHIVARSGWDPDELGAENLGPRTTRAFTYFGTLIESGEYQPEPQSPEMKALRAKRLETIEASWRPTPRDGPRASSRHLGFRRTGGASRSSAACTSSGAAQGGRGGTRRRVGHQCIVQRARSQGGRWNTTKASPPDRGRSVAFGPRQLFELSLDDSDSVGAKAANLGTLITAASVPPGGVVVIASETDDGIGRAVAEALAVLGDANGGSLVAHASLVAREYGISRGRSQRRRVACGIGQRITIDGSSGLLELLGEHADGAIGTRRIGTSRAPGVPEER